MGRPNVDSEQLVVGMDIRDRRQRNSRCLTSALLFVLFVAALAFCHHLGYPHRPHHHPHHPRRVPWDGPRKIVIQESRALIMFGWGKADLVSQVILEAAPVQHLTLHVLQAEVSRPKYSDPMDRQGPVLQFKVAKILDSKLVTFYIPEDHPEDSGRLTIKIQIPYEYDGSLIVDGSFLNIRGSNTAQSLLRQWWWQWLHRQQWQRQVRFSELSLTTDEGSIDLRGGHVQAAVFKAVVKRRGDIHTGALEEAVLGGGLEAVVKSAVGLVSLDARMALSKEPLEWTGGYHIKAVAGQGRLQLNVQDEDRAIAGGRGGEGAGGVALRPEVLRIEAESMDGELDARVELMDGQALYLDAESAHEAIVKLSDKYSGRFAAASTDGEAMVVPKRESESVIHYHRLDREERRGVKYPAGAEGLEDIVGDHVRVTGTGATKIVFV